MIIKTLIRRQVLQDCDLRFQHHLRLRKSHVFGRLFAQASLFCSVIRRLNYLLFRGIRGVVAFTHFFKNNHVSTRQVVVNVEVLIRIHSKGTCETEIYWLMVSWSSLYEMVTDCFETSY